MSPQRHRTAEVMRDHAGTVQRPAVQQRRERLRLAGEIDRILGSLGGPAVARHVPGVDGEVRRERIGVWTPDFGGERGAMTEHHRGTVPNRSPDDRTPGPLKRIAHAYLLR